MSLDPFYQLKLYDYISPVLIDAGYGADKIYYGYQNGLRETGQYCIINLTEIDDDIPVEVRNKFDPANNPDNDIIETQVYRALLTFTVDLFGNKSLENARKIRAKLFSSASINEMNKQGFGFVGMGSIANLSELMNAVYKERIAFPISLNILYAYTDIIKSIKQVRVVGMTDRGFEVMDTIITED